MSKFGMGRGLADIQHEMGNVPDISVLTGAGRVVVKQIPLAQIGANPDQPRKTFTESELSELAASIKEKGVLQPILLRAVTGQPYMYEIVAGERRFRASKMAGLSEIPALVKTITPESAMEIALIENVQRENLNAIEEAAAYKNIMEKCNYELSDVARLIGKSESYIRNIMRLDTLPNDVKDMVKSGAISASHARAIAVAENPTELAHRIIDNKMSVSDTERVVRTSVRKKSSRAYNAHTIDEQTIRDMEKQISSALSVHVQVKEKRGGAGQIILSFATRTQMHDLINKLIGN
mgnify:CR=1 FL=1